jgi:hypothetical protein
MSRPAAAEEDDDDEEYGPPPPPKTDPKKVTFGRTTEKDRQKAEELGYVLTGAKRARLEAERAKRAEPTEKERRQQLMEKLDQRRERELVIVEDMKKLLEARKAKS